MKAMILAAGKGTRVRPLTYDLPKPMIPLLGKPVMAYLVEHLKKHGVTEIMVNVSWLHEKIEEYFGEGHQFGVQIGYSFEGYIKDNGEIVPEPIGSAGGMKKIPQQAFRLDRDHVRRRQVSGHGTKSMRALMTGRLCATPRGIRHAPDPD